MGWPDDANKFDDPDLSVMPVKFVNMARHDPTQLNPFGSLVWLDPTRSSNPLDPSWSSGPLERCGLSGLTGLFELSSSPDLYVSLSHLVCLGHRVCPTVWVVGPARRPALPVCVIRSVPFVWIVWSVQPIMVVGFVTSVWD